MISSSTPSFSEKEFHEGYDRIFGNKKKNGCWRCDTELITEEQLKRHYCDKCEKERPHIESTGMV